MMQRAPNQNQIWYCKMCGRETAHIINFAPSERRMLRGDIPAYERSRECQECAEIISPGGEPEGYTHTVEMDTSHFDNLCKELDSLRKFKGVVKQALDAMDSNSVGLTSLKV